MRRSADPTAEQIDDDGPEHSPLPGSPTPEAAPSTETAPTLRAEVPFFVNEDRVLATALAELDKDPAPTSCDEANDRIRHLAIRFHETRTADATDTVAVSCPVFLEPDRRVPDRREEPDRRTQLIDTRETAERERQFFDWATVGLNAAYGDLDTAAALAVDATAARLDGPGAGLTRALTGTFLIWVAPTTVIGQTVTMLGDALREINGLPPLDRYADALPLLQNHLLLGSLTRQGEQTPKG
ncbi:hypothetical protein H9Y04_37745 [Streptomyces sp. TRM66268-LWL]|uniref:Uncharacterized protein n=1 Tax=Streptomyces polyasparticus TaxID=2767826 RepID=A0ABR7SU20_9ACTN|nr:hypothetical protein [Streptomyces polyasparticus]MBC9718284.1 hypothetical protein [Streptomyces polyasparticus]